MSIRNIVAALTLATMTLPANAQTGDTKVYVARFLDDKAAAISYTFDDGLLDQYTVLFPKLKEHGIRGSFCVNGNTINRNEAKLAANGTSTDSLVIKKPRMTWAMIKEMSDQGQEMTSHGWAHTNLKKIEGEALRYEVQHNDTVIWQHTGKFPRTFFYPGNAKSPEKIAYAERDRVGSRTFQVSIGSKRDDKWLREWVRRLIAEREWGVGMTHGIVTGYDHFSDPEILWRHFEDVNTLRDSLWIGTFHDVCAYTKERDAVKLTVRTSRKRIKVTPRLSLNPAIFSHPLTLVVERGVKEARQGGKALKVATIGGKSLVTFDPHGGCVTLRLSGKALKL